MRFYLIAGTLRVYSLSSTGSSSEKSMEYAAEFSLYIYLLCGRSVPNYDYITFRKKLQVREREREKKTLRVKENISIYSHYLICELSIPMSLGQDASCLTGKVKVY